MNLLGRASSWGSDSQQLAQPGCYAMGGVPGVGVRVRLWVLDDQLATLKKVQCPQQEEWYEERTGMLAHEAVGS